MTPLPMALYDASGTRALDGAAIETHAIPGMTLMERAARAAYRRLRAQWPYAKRLLVACGSGNNGGDGYLLAELAVSDGLEVDLVAWSEPRSADAASARARALARGLRPRAPGPGGGRADVAVDAILGTGLDRAPEGSAAAAIELIGSTGVPVLAVDLPSGLASDTGDAPGPAVRADVTVTFIGLKIGLFTGRGPALAGSVSYDDLGVPPPVFDDVQPVAHRLVPATMRAKLPRREADAHKGRGGHVLVVGGDRGMSGAPRMAAEAAYRSGAGLVSVATHPAHADAIPVACAELMSHPVDPGQAAADLGAAIERATVIALGPGLGQGWFGRAVMASLLDAALPLVVDADALNLLAEEPCARDDWILTPHPGEAARLLGTDSRSVQADRPAAARAIQETYGGVCVLKGAGTLVCGAGALALCDRGNPGMATGGMGDVLTGVVAAMRAQGLDGEAAARLGVWVHASAADRAAVRGMVGLMATDVVTELPLALEALREAP